MSQSNEEGDSQPKRLPDQNHDSQNLLNTSHEEVLVNSSKSAQSDVNLNFLGYEMDKENRVGLFNDSSPSKPLNSVSTSDQKRKRIARFTKFGDRWPSGDMAARAKSSNSRRRQRRSSMAVPPVLFWDCPMFPNGLEEEDFFLRLSDDGGWGAHLSFRVPPIKRHGELVASLC